MLNVKFLPPKQNPLLTRLIQSIFYLVMYFAYEVKLETSDRLDSFFVQSCSWPVTQLHRLLATPLAGEVEREREKE